MASTPAKKAGANATTSSARKGALNSTSATSDGPSKSPTRPVASNGTGTANTPPVSRTRSVRTGGPASARAAARKPATTPTDPADEDAKAELQARLEELQEQVRKAEEDATKAQQKATSLQSKLDEVLKDQSMLEENVHEHLERINDLEVEKKESLRARRELEQIFESERAAVMKDKEESQTREDEMKTMLQRLKESLAQKELRAGLDDDGRPGIQRSSSSFRKSMTPSPNSEAIAQFAPPASLERSDSRSSSKLVMQKDKIIEELRLELAEAQIRLVEVENIGGGRVQQLEKEMYGVKMQNARLMEENDSFQLLLREKTLNGDFSPMELLRPSSKGGSSPPSGVNGGTLADELGESEEHEGGEAPRKYQSEVNSLKDTNKALTLYINNIISRLLEHGQFEQILDKTPDIFAGPNAASARYQQADKDKDLPPPPPEKDQSDEQPQGFLQRARSVIGGRPKARPLSQIIDNQSTSNENIPPSLHENPQTAPRLPLGRSGHRRANSDWAAANIVNNMYRGPTTGALANPASPGLTSPGTRTTGFFTAPQTLSNTQRNPSGASVPTIPESGTDDDLKDTDLSEQKSPPPPPPRDSKVPPRSRDSMVSNPDTTAGSEVLSNPSSPPRSQGSSNERDGRFPAGMKTASSVMSGSGMRPLRLVQENVMQEDEAARKAANRGSWFGFLNKGA